MSPGRYCLSGMFSSSLSLQKQVFLFGRTLKEIPLPFGSRVFITVDEEVL